MPPCEDSGNLAYACDLEVAGESDDLCECGRPPGDCATTEGAEYHMDRDDFLKHGVPAWMTEESAL